MYGYVYLKIGVIVTAFFAGLFPGAALGNMIWEKKYNILVISEILLMSLLLIFFAWVVFSKSEIPQIVFLIYCFLFSFLAGLQFPVVTRIVGEKNSPMAGCLAADFIGAAAGTLAVGTFLIPSYGIKAAVIFIILIKLSSSAMALLTRR
jgi:predicted membrane-bound spermidine synthase